MDIDNKMKKFIEDNIQVQISRTDTYKAKVIEDENHIIFIGNEELEEEGDFHLDNHWCKLCEDYIGDADSQVFKHAQKHLSGRL